MKKQILAILLTASSLPAYPTDLSKEFEKYFAEREAARERQHAILDMREALTYSVFSILDPKARNMKDLEILALIREKLLPREKICLQKHTSDDTLVCMFEVAEIFISSNWPKPGNRSDAIDKADKPRVSGHAPHDDEYEYKLDDGRYNRDDGRYRRAR